MRPIFYGTVSVAMVLAVAACDAPDTPGAGAALETDDQKASYALGRNMGQQLTPAADHIDLPALFRGVREVLDEKGPALPQQELNRVVQQLSRTVQEEQRAEQQSGREGEAEENRRAGAEYRTEYAEKAGVTQTESGLLYEILEPGSGDPPGPGDTVVVQYRGTLVDGTTFDTSYDRSGPSTFPIEQVIPGFGEGLQLMRPGGKARLVIPPDLGYGLRGQGRIGPNETLIFEVELLEVR